MIARFVDDLASKGKYCFSVNDAMELSNSTDIAVRAALRRLREKGEIAMPYKGFYVIVPPEYRNLGCLPAEQFIPSLLDHLDEYYYAGLLSAAQYHGAAHHRPQIFQVVVSKARNDIECGKVRVKFIYRKKAKEIPTEERNTPRGLLRISSPESTAFDLIGYPDHAGGLNNVATILMDLAEKIDSNKLAEVAIHSPISWAQRLGYVMDLVGVGEKAHSLLSYVHNRRPVCAPTPLARSSPHKGVERDKRWQVLINTKVEAEF